ncbi:MAG: BPSL0067 family protein [Beijerinckiaceae bacterium]
MKRRAISAVLALFSSVAFAGETAVSLMQAGMPQQCADYAAKVSGSEGNFGTTSPNNCLGAFQFCPGTFESYYSGTSAQFLADPQAQVKAWTKYQQDQYGLAQKNGMTSLVGSQVCSDGQCSTVTDSSILMACQFGCGSKGKLANYMNGGDCNAANVKDGNGTSVCTYLKKGADFDASCFTGKPNTDANACPPGTEPTAPTTPQKTGDYQKYVGQYQGINQECASLTKALDPNLGATSSWQKGEQVQGNAYLKPGTAIATFNFGGNYGPPSSPGGASGVSHTGIYLGQDASGVQILDQWNGSGGARTHTIPWDSWNGNSMEAGNKYYTIL